MGLLGLAGTQDPRGETRASNRSVMREEPPEPRPRVTVDTRTMENVDDVSADVSRWVALAEHVLINEGLGSRQVELTVHLVDEDSIAELNHEHMGGQGPTDVLAFPIDDPAEVPHDQAVLLGDVVICPEVAARQVHFGAGGRDTSSAGDGLQGEVSQLLVHGALHLLGYDHAERGEREVMQRRESELLEGFGN